MDKLFEKNNIVLNEIKNLIINMRNKYFFTIEGSYCMYKKDDDNFNKFVNSKISNLCSCINSLTSDNLNICEIGFNAGHSATFIANTLDNKSYNFYIFDIRHHIYTKPCFELFKSIFKNENNNIHFIEGNSIITIPKYINDNNLIGTFDFIHIDGGHTKECIDSDLKYADILIKNDGIIIIDDTNYNCINDAVDYYINNKNYVEIFLLDLKDFIYPHRIIQKKMI